MTILELLEGLEFGSREKPGTMSTKSEIRRWIKNKAIIVNGKAVDVTEDITDDVVSLVLFPNSKRITLW